MQLGISTNEITPLAPYNFISFWQIKFPNKFLLWLPGILVNWNSRLVVSWSILTSWNMGSNIFGPWKRKISIAYFESVDDVINRIHDLQFIL